LNAEPGTIFETDKLAGMPMEILVNGTLYARGEVVALRDQMAVRVVDFVPPEKR